MKKIISFLSVALLTSLGMSAQDKVVLTDGQTLDVKVVKITADAVQYVFGEETLVNETPKRDIVEITFASGRRQTFNATAPTAAVDKKNVLVVRNDGRQADKDFIITNCTGQVVDYKIYGTLKNGGDRQLIGRGLLAVYEKKKIDLAVAKGKLDNFTQFDIEVENELNHTSEVRSSDLRVYLYPKFGLGNAVSLDGEYMQSGASELQVKNTSSKNVDFLLYGSDSENGEKSLIFGGSIAGDVKRRSTRIFVEKKPYLYLYYNQELKDVIVNIQGGYFKITFK